MQSETMYSGDEHFTITIAEVDRFPEPEEKTPVDRQLCGISLCYAEHYIRVSIHSASGTISHSISRHFPDKKVYLEIGVANDMATNHEIPMESV